MTPIETLNAGRCAGRRINSLVSFLHYHSIFFLSKSDYFNISGEQHQISRCFVFESNDAPLQSPTHESTFTNKVLSLIGEKLDEHNICLADHPWNKLWLDMGRSYVNSIFEVKNQKLFWPSWNSFSGTSLHDWTCAFSSKIGPLGSQKLPFCAKLYSATNFAIFENKKEGRKWRKARAATSQECSRQISYWVMLV